MFGKRSFLPALSRQNYGNKDIEVISPGTKDGEEYEVVNNPALDMTRDEPLTRAMLDQCIQLQRSPGKF